MTRSIIGCLSAAVAFACTSERAETDRAVKADTIHMSQLGAIGEIDGDPNYMFGRIAAVAADDSGTVYVGDSFGSTVRAYSAEGNYLGTVGKEGEGPGEFRYLRDLAFDRAGNLHVMSAFRISVFRPSITSQFADSLVHTLALRGIDSPPGMRAKADDASYYIPSYSYRDYLIRGHFYVVIDSTGTVADTVHVPRFPNPEFSGRATYPVDEQGRGQGVEGVNRAPFEAAPVWDVTLDGHVWASPGDRYTVVQVAPSGDTVQLISHSNSARRIPDQEIEDSMRAFRARLDSIPVPLNRMRGMSDLARKAALPAFLPEIIGVQADPEGNIWLKRWPRTGLQETLFDVFSPAGLSLGTVRLPARIVSTPVPWLSRKLVIGVVRDPADQVDRVVVFGSPGWKTTGQ